MSGVLLVEKNGHRLVHLLQEDSIACEFLSEDSLGAAMWKTMRKIPRMASTGFSGPLRENMLYHFLLEMFKEEGQDLPISPAYSRRLEEL